MNNQMERPRGHSTTYEEDIHDQDAGTGVHIGHKDEDHGEKKSVLKKVKAKAKKIKDSIKEHVGHGHEVHHGHDDHDDDEDDEMDTDPEIHDTHAAQSFVPGHEEVARQHEPKQGDRSTNQEGAAVISNPADDYQKSDPTTARFNPGQDETLGWSRTDTARPKEFEERPYAPRNTPIVAMHSREGHSTSTGELDMGKKGPPAKYGGLVERLTDLETDPQAPKDVGEQRHPANYQAKVADPTGNGNDSKPAQSYMPGLHRSKLGEKTPMEGVIHADPSSKPQSDYQTFDPTNTSYIPGQEETLGLSRTNGGTLKGSEESSIMPGLHRSKQGVRTPMEGVIHADPSSNPQSGYQTLNPTTTSYVPGQEETLGWSRTDTGRSGMLKESKEHSDRDSRKLGGILGSSELLEKDPHAPTGPGEKRHAENYESKVTDPTSKGGEEIGVTPILHHLDRMKIQDESQEKAITGQQESMFKPKHSPQDEKISTGSHDQFSPEPVTSKTAVFFESPESGSQFDTTSSGMMGSHGDSEQTQGSYTEKITSTAAMMADKAKQATSSVTSKLGYGGSSDQHSTTATSGPHDTHSESGGYGDKISNVTAAITGKAVQAKDVVATKLGYGGTHERQPVQEAASKGGSNVESVADSTVGSDVHGSEMGNEAGPTTTTGPSTGTDRGVSVKTYLAEKLKPGEEDKALAEVIADALPLHKRKEDVSGTGEEDERRKVTIKGRVTESEEVARELGRSEETDYDNAGAGLASPGKGVMERIKDAAGAWFQKSGETLPKDATEGVVTGVKDAVSEKW